MPIFRFLIYVCLVQPGSGPVVLKYILSTKSRVLQKDFIQFLDSTKERNISELYSSVYMYYYKLEINQKRRNRTNKRSCMPND